MIGKRLFVAENRFDAFAKGRQLGGHGVPDQLVVHAMIGMAEDVAHSAEALPVVIGVSFLSNRAEPFGRFAEDEQLPLDG